jgi:hypothetical protein
LKNREDIKKIKVVNKDGDSSHEKVSELEDEELNIGVDKNGNSKEVIFADLAEGSYFGELALHTSNKDRQNLRDVREGRCYTSVWTV